MTFTTRSTSTSKAGVRLVWLVDPRAQRITVYLPDRTARTLGAADTLDGADVLPDFQQQLTDLFSWGSVVT
ncbi:MAG TPA: Uma2 family endonuclease [Chloroflexota bacterium]